MSDNPIFLQVLWATRIEGDDMKTQKMNRNAGLFKWTIGGWLGIQIGGTGWLLLMGILLVFHGDMIAGISLIVCFLGLNAIGVFLWYQRDEITPYHGSQLFAALIGGFSTLTITLVDWAGYFPDGATASDYTKALLIIPAIMVIRHLQERSRREEEKENG